MHYKTMVDKNKVYRNKFPMAYVKMIHMMETTLTCENYSITDSDQRISVLEQIWLAWNF